MNPTKAASAITRAGWITWCWIDVTTQGDAETVYVRGRQRPIEDAKEAAEQFDTWVQAARNIYGGFPFTAEMKNDCIVKGK